jgi:hypothetical protein
MTRKNYDRKKKYSRLAGYVFRTTGKNYDPAKFWQELGQHYFPADCFGIDCFFLTICQKIIWSQFPPNFGRNWDCNIFRRIVLGSIFFPVVIISGCYLNPPKNIAGQTTVPFFSSSNFSGCKYHNWCSCQNTNTNYDPKKLRPKKNRYSRLAGYVL